MSTATVTREPNLQPWRATLAGLSASLVGIGLARFAYTPLLPVIIQAHWFSASTAAYLGAANLGGYLAGALIAAPLATRLSAPAVLKAMMLAATIAFFACAWPVNFFWFFAWRFLSGIAGGALMVLAAPTVLPHIPPARRGIASGVIFMGVGLGIAASGTLVPLLLHRGLTATWIGLGIVSLLLTLIAWTGWPRTETQTTHHAHHHRQHPTARLWTLYAEYGLNAFGLVPHMVFLVAFVATGLHQGLATGAEYWVLFGLGAAVGPLLSGHLADRTGFAPALRLAYLTQALAISLVLTNLGSPALMVSSFITGAFTPGIVPLVLGRVQELLPHHPVAQKTAWSRATTSFALMQAVSAYFMSFLFDQSGGSYDLLFACGTAALVLALAINLIAGIALSRQDP